MDGHNNRQEIPKESMSLKTAPQKLSNLKNRKEKNIWRKIEQGISDTQDNVQRLSIHMTGVLEKGKEDIKVEITFYNGPNFT